VFTCRGMDESEGLVFTEELFSYLHEEAEENDENCKCVSLCTGRDSSGEVLSTSVHVCQLMAKIS
jgi:hypothetical protein